MFNRLFHTPPSPRQIAAIFRRLGWIGFWDQVVLGIIANSDIYWEYVAKVRENFLPCPPCLPYSSQPGFLKLLNWGSRGQG